MSGESNIKSSMHHLYRERPPDYWPIIYCDDYNLSFCGLEKLHFFDAHRSRHILQVRKLLIVSFKVFTDT